MNPDYRMDKGQKVLFNKDFFNFIDKKYTENTRIENQG